MYPQALKDQALKMHIEGHKPAQILEFMRSQPEAQDKKKRVSLQTILRWVAHVPSKPTLMVCAAQRLEALIQAPVKSAADLQEMALLLKAFFREDEGSAKSDRHTKKTPPKEELYKNSFEHVDLSQPLPRPKLYWHQEMALNETASEQFHLKPRQVGFTNIFIAIGAIEDMLKTKQDQIFISASLKQVSIILIAIRKWARKLYQVRLTGSIDKGITVTLPGGDAATFWFLSPNANLTQGPSGKLWIDEAAWMAKSTEVLAVARSMAALKGRGVVIVTTPSFVDTPMHYLWEGRDERGEPVVDSIKRIAWDIDEIVAKGYDLMDLEDIKKRWTGQIYEQQFKLKWLNSSDSYFERHLLEQCQTAEVWSYQGGVCSAGYDPAIKVHSAAFCVVEHCADGKLRVVHTESWDRKPLEDQEAAIFKLCQRFRVASCYMDISGGIGGSVCQRLQRSLGNAIIEVSYNPEVKIRMLENAKNIMQARQLLYSKEQKELTDSLLAIYLDLTKSKQRLTFRIAGNKRIFHGDLGQALLLAMRGYDYATGRASGRTQGSFELAA